ncbi:MAG: DNA gyrase inhibitor YacG [Nitrospirae bacterium]|nr:DNA gyrase inhibitor YacG [Nitrospirota bacterium]
MLCPICKNEAAWEGNPHRPFCSERCKLIDLGAWADARYSVPAEDASGDSDAERQGKDDAEG